MAKFNLFWLQVVCRAAKNETHAGFTTIVTAMGHESKTNTFATCDTLTQCLIQQWFDYAVLYVLPSSESKAASENVLQVSEIFVCLDVWISIISNCCHFHSGIERVFLTALIFGWTIINVSRCSCILLIIWYHGKLRGLNPL